MAMRSTEVVFEGWLTKSPPSKRIWRARWRRRWFALTYSGEIPGQFVLTYYTDRNRRKLKGSIDLDNCEQVDLGLKLDEKKLKFDHVFDIKTPTRTYYLAADSEDEMKSWVQCICKVCGLKSTSEDDEFLELRNTQPVSTVTTNPYIPISECTTGTIPIYGPQDLKKLLENNMINAYSRDDLAKNYQNLSSSQNGEADKIIGVTDDMYDFPRLHQMESESIASTSTSTLTRHCYNNAAPVKVGDTQVFRYDDYLNTPKKNALSNSQNHAHYDVEDNGLPSLSYSNLPSPMSSEGGGALPPAVSRDLKPKPIRKLSDVDVVVPPPVISRTSKPATPLQKMMGVTDDMYDFPRSHQMESESIASTSSSTLTRHCYNNAAPVKVGDTQMFRYDDYLNTPKKSAISPNQNNSNYDVDDNGLQSSSYTNLPSPMSSESGGGGPPPAVNRDLKPKATRKLSDTDVIVPPPAVNRTLKPLTPVQDAQMRKKVTSATVGLPDTELAEMSSISSHTLNKYSVKDTVEPDEQIYHYLPAKMQYLDLDLEYAGGTTPSATLMGCSMDANLATAAVQQPNTSSNTLPKLYSTVYKKVDFMKTHALNVTRNNLEKERQEPLLFTTKKS